MRTFICSSLLCIAMLLPRSSTAGDRLKQIEVLKPAKTHSVNQNEENYRGYKTHLSAIVGRRDFNEFLSTLQRQLDIVESAGLSPRVLSFFHSVPIVAEELACLEKETQAVGCYVRVGTPGGFVPRAYRVWDSEKSQWTNPNQAPLASDGGVVMVRPLLVYESQRPVLLHELLHAFHANIMPQGFRNEGILFHFGLAKSQRLYPENSYVMKNEQEFFAVTASIFLYGKDAAHEPFTRSNLKEKQPDYFKYLVWLFEFDPDRAPNASPVASAY